MQDLTPKFSFGEFSEKKKEELSKFQEKFNINICSISKQFIKEYYNLPNCICGFTFILDEKNRIRLANTGINIELLKKIINKELRKKISLFGGQK